MFLVMSKSCDQCLMTKNKIVSDRRRDRILEETEKNDSHFICHKATMAGKDIACFGHFSSTGGGRLGRMSKHFGLVQYVDPKTLGEGTGQAAPNPTDICK